VRERYQKQFHKKTVEKIKLLPETALREFLIKFAENPDVGLAILEDCK